jgi:phage shock protein C
MKKLTKSSSNKMVCGVCAGIGNYFNIDPTVIRVVWAILSLICAFFPGVIAYVIAAIVIPYDNEIRD